VVLGIFAFADEVLFGATHAATVSTTRAEVSTALGQWHNTDTSAFRFIRMFTNFAALYKKMDTYL
jgi:hypothetical protein